MNLADNLGAAGDPADALSRLRELLPDCLRVLGKNHPDTLNVRSRLAFWRGVTGDLAGAAAAFDELLADALLLLNPDHPFLLGVRGTLAVARASVGDLAGALAAFDELQAESQRVLGPDHPDTLEARRFKAACQGEAGDPAGAAAALETLLADYQRVLGPDHPDTLEARHFKAACQGEAGDPAGAAAALETLLADYQRVLGPDHPDTLEARKCLGDWQQRQADEAARRADIIRIELGSELIPFADPQLIEEIGRIRGELATQEHGWALPIVRITDARDIGGREYRIWLRGEIIMLAHALTDCAALVGEPGATTAPANVTEEPGFLPQRVRWLTGRQAARIPETFALTPATIIAGNLKHLADDHRPALEADPPRPSSDEMPEHGPAPRNPQNEDLSTPRRNASLLPSLWSTDSGSSSPQQARIPQRLSELRLEHPHLRVFRSPGQSLQEVKVVLLRVEASGRDGPGR